MIKILLSTMLSLNPLVGDMYELSPLNKEDVHHFHYRMLMIDSSLSRATDYIYSLNIDDDVREDILREIFLIDFNLGKREYGRD